MQTPAEVPYADLGGGTLCRLWLEGPYADSGIDTVGDRGKRSLSHDAQSQTLDYPRLPYRLNAVIEFVNRCSPRQLVCRYHCLFGCSL